MAATRPNPFTLDTPTLLVHLQAVHRRIVGILDGLDQVEMHRTMLPSGWTFAGMVNHLTVTTTFWFDNVMSGDEFVPVADDFAVAPDVRPETLLRRYTEATQRGHDRVRSLPLDTPPAWWPPDLFGPWRLSSLYEVLQHLLVESSTHAGHLDIARELHDGRTWAYPLGRLADAG
jgi:uncharacterized damage-inducible protein DinB